MVGLNMVCLGADYGRAGGGGGPLYIISRRPPRPPNVLPSPSSSPLSARPPFLQAPSLSHPHPYPIPFSFPITPPSHSGERDEGSGFRVQSLLRDITDFPFYFTVVMGDRIIDGLWPRLRCLKSFSSPFPGLAICPLHCGSILVAICFSIIPLCAYTLPIYPYLVASSSSLKPSS